MPTTPLGIFFPDGTEAFPSAAWWEQQSESVDDALQKLQAKSTVKTNLFSASVAQGAESGDVTGLTVAITPTAADAKIVGEVTITVAQTSGTDQAVGVTVYRNGTAIQIGGSAGSRPRVTGSIFTSGVDRIAASGTITFEDEPGTASAVTYSVRLRHSHNATATIVVNRTSADTDSDRHFRSTSRISVAEVGVG